MVNLKTKLKNNLKLNKLSNNAKIGSIDSIIIRYGEIGLKKGNRSVFQKKLVLNIKDCYRKHKTNFCN